jgi:sporulation integral membrane protein YtvI
MKRYVLIFVLIGLIVFLLPKSMPLIIGLLTAIFFEPLILYLQKSWKSRRLLPVTVVFIIFLTVTGFISYLLVAKLVDQLLYFSNNLPFIFAEINTMISIYIIKWEVYSESIPLELIRSIESSFRSLEVSLLKGTSKLTESTILLFTSIPEILVEILVYFVSLFLFSLDLPKIKQSLFSLFKEKTKEKILFVFSQLNKVGIGFIKAQILFSFLTFFLAYSGLLILKVEYPLLLSIVIVFVDILPVLGAGSVLVPLAVYSFLANQQDAAIGILLLFVVITIVRRVIEPKVYSSSMGISPLASLISMFLGFKLIGFIGLIIGPAVVIIFDTLRKSKIINIHIRI